MVIEIPYFFPTNYIAWWCSMIVSASHEFGRIWGPTPVVVEPTTSKRCWRSLAPNSRPGRFGAKDLSPHRVGFMVKPGVFQSMDLERSSEHSLVTFLNKRVGHIMIFHDISAFNRWVKKTFWYVFGNGPKLWCNFLETTYKPYINHIETISGWWFGIFLLCID